MSTSKYFAHMYGIMVGQYPLKEKFNEIDTDYGMGDLYGILYELLYRNKEGLPEPVPNVRGMDLVGSPVGIVCVGYEAIMPYAQCTMTKDQMDKNLQDLAAYLYGTEIAKKIRPEEIFDAWSE